MSLVAKPTENIVECSKAIFNCTEPTPSCHNSAGFDFPTLWNITTNYFDQCPNGPWLYRSPGSVGPTTIATAALTGAACVALAGVGRKIYPSSDIWYRLTTWKFPLFQLVANSPRPPLSFAVEAFTIVHFLGDPIGMITDLLKKIDGCQSRAVFWQDHLLGELAVLRVGRSVQQIERLWKSLAIVVDSYDEWGVQVGDKAQRCLFEELSSLCRPEADPAIRDRFLVVCLRTADALAADRSTKFLPVIVAQGFFISSIAIAIIRTKSLSAGEHPATYINIEMYSIGFTAQFFWVIFAVILTSIIGASQTAGALPRILTRLHNDLRKEFPLQGFPGMTIKLPTDYLTEPERITNGGIYSWQPGRKWQAAARNSSLEHLYVRNPQIIPTKTERYLTLPFLRFVWPVLYHFLPFGIILAAAITGQTISALIPPVGWSCRSEGEAYIFVTWVGSSLVSHVPFRGHHRVQFWSVFLKDLICIGITMGIIIDTQVGIYNRCDCYTKYSLVGLALPQMPAAKKILEGRLAGWYPAITSIGITFQLVLVPALLGWRYHSAVRVFLQRDDGSSNLEWWHTFCDWRRRRGEYQVAAGMEGVAVPVAETGGYAVNERPSEENKAGVVAVEAVKRKALRIVP